MNAASARNRRARMARALGVLSALACGVGCSDGAQEKSALDAGTFASAIDGAVDSSYASVLCDALDARGACRAGAHCSGNRCEPDWCGDGVRNGSEQCDDGNQQAGDGCDPSCRSEFHGCGDGVLEADEECDDGNRVDADGCSNLCTENQCGNGDTDPGEECDDGNRIDDDRCSNDCMVVKCRNGRLDPGEECDDGNTNDDDSCTNACKISVCGDGKIEAHETCDDGNTLDGDSCPSNCVDTQCGNGVIESGEACDGPHIDPGGTSWDCSADCRQKQPYGCAACQKAQCTNYMGAGLDVIQGCFRMDDAAKQLRAQFGAPEGDPQFAQSCIDVVNCALIHRCGLECASTGGRGPDGCYCGSAMIDSCAADGPAVDAPCAQEWLTAARTNINADVQIRYTDVVYPLGWAYALLDCYACSCADTCAPK
ncbi:MAG TPA: DUF4215 domain-containing protein [Polyangiaceae bacterium]|nr:DUF4215 domain-containing protein [Polyangiaceae bacterium]